jgi:hypothetical protein
MNERIRELHSQCKVCDNDTLLYFDYERFAELIVQEVINIAEDSKNYNRTIYTTHDVDRAKALMADLVKAIKQQLG